MKKGRQICRPLSVSKKFDTLLNLQDFLASDSKRGRHNAALFSSFD